MRLWATFYPADPANPERGLLLPEIPPIANLFAITSLEAGMMGGLAATLSRFTFNNASFWQVTGVVHQSLLLSRLTAEAAQHAADGDLGMGAGLCIATCVHGLVAMLVMLVVPRHPSALVWLALVSQAWAHIAGVSILSPFYT